VNTSADISDNIGWDEASADLRFTNFR